ncbi:MAG: adenine deaminase [Candidatus Hadarchaeota archaeon]|nr:adenine deaminase [Candidatus Hadarchaeota archaeon]
MDNALVDVAMGRATADLVVKNGELVNVNTGQIEHDVDVAVKGSRIALVGDASHCVGKRTKVIDADGYLVPGLLDGHLHVESSMLTLTQFARAVLPRGTTGIFIDPHEIANVLGMRGVKLMRDEGKGLPLKVFVLVPSCVPSAPGFETSGAEITAPDIKEGLEWERVVGLGEVMNFPGVLKNDPKLRAKIGATLRVGKVVEGHAPGLLDKKLSAYRAAGVESDHESTTPEEAVQRLRLGMKLEIREGSTAKNLMPLIKSVLERGFDTRHCLLVSDDRHPSDLIREGHVDHLIRRAIEEGLDPVRAVQMATLNTAEHFDRREIGSISPGKVADLVVVKDLEKFTVGDVITDGKLVARDGKLLADFKKPVYPTFARATMHLRREVRPEDFQVRCLSEGEVEIKLIEVSEGNIGTGYGTQKLGVENGIVQPCPEKDVAKVAVVERHKRTGNISRGFVRGFGIREGAIASSVAHDAHNLIVVGLSDVDMATAVNSLADMEGGLIAVRDSKVLAELGLPIAGLMSERTAEEVSTKLEGLHDRAKELGVRVKSPFMQLSFLSLPVIPKLKITDRGLVDVDKYKLVDLFEKP